MADRKSTDHAPWKFNALYADTEVRSAADDKLLAVVHGGPEQARIVSLLKAATQPNAALAGGWISVDERLPESGVEVLCAGVGWGEAFVMACYYDEERREWYSINTHWTDATGNAQYPTHWRPLPPPPTLNASKEGSHRNKPASPAEAEELAKKAVGDYLTACRMDTAENIGNYLMKLCSVAGVLMANAEGSESAAARLEGTAAFVLKNMPRQPARLTPIQ